MSKAEEMLEALERIKAMADNLIRNPESPSPSDRVRSSIRMVYAIATGAIARATPTKSPDAGEMVEITRDGVTSFHEVVPEKGGAG